MTLFAERGIDAATTREIAALAGTTERTLFKHFGNKDRLTTIVLEEVTLNSMRTQSYARIMDETPFTPDTFRAWHRQFLTERIEGAVAAPNDYRILFRELFRNTDLAHRYGAMWRASVFAPMSAHLARMQESGWIARDNSATALTGAFFSLNIGYLVARFALQPSGDWSAEDVDTVVRLFSATCGWKT